ncbi:hypothetical protein DTO271G3_3855 [Paecilomyces variotii]|nr:hypothetical protein DTO271G3_3855 [Paecilomyces variotii]
MSPGAPGFSVFSYFYCFSATDAATKPKKLGTADVTTVTATTAVEEPAIVENQTVKVEKPETAIYEDSSNDLAKSFEFSEDKLVLNNTPSPFLLPTVLFTFMCLGPHYITGGPRLFSASIYSAPTTKAKRLGTAEESTVTATTAVENPEPKLEAETADPETVQVYEDAQSNDLAKSFEFSEDKLILNTTPSPFLRPTVRFTFMCLGPHRVTGGPGLLSLTLGFSLLFCLCLGPHHVTGGPRLFSVLIFLLFFPHSCAWGPILSPGPPGFSATDAAPTKAKRLGLLESTDTATSRDEKPGEKLEPAIVEPGTVRVYEESNDLAQSFEFSEDKLVLNDTPSPFLRPERRLWLSFLAFTGAPWLDSVFTYPLHYRAQCSPSMSPIRTYILNSFAHSSL